MLTGIQLFACNVHTQRKLLLISLLDGSMVRQRFIVNDHCGALLAASPETKFKGNLPDRFALADILLRDEGGTH